MMAGTVLNKGIMPPWQMGIYFVSGWVFGILQILHT